MRKGIIKNNKFKSVLFQTMKVNIDERVLNRIEEYYVDDQDKTMINYFRFCDDLDIVFNLPDREKEPTLRPKDFDYTVTYTRK